MVGGYLRELRLHSPITIGRLKPANSVHNGIKHQQDINQLLYLYGFLGGSVANHITCIIMLF